MILIRQKASFPDLVLRRSDSTEFEGGEFVELKTSQSFSIPSFNSTLPTAKKLVGSLSRDVQARMLTEGQSDGPTDQRRVFYLLVGRRKSTNMPHTKVCLVSGAFFETIPVEHLLASAVSKVLGSQQVAKGLEASLASTDDLQNHFAQTREVADASVKVRFRVMAEVHPKANLFRAFPDEIDNDTISFVEEANQTKLKSSNELTAWKDASQNMRQSTFYRKISTAIEETKPRLVDDLTIGTIEHPMGGIFNIAQSRIYSLQTGA